MFNEKNAIVTQRVAFHVKQLYNVSERCDSAHDNHALVRIVYPDNGNLFLTIVKRSLLKILRAWPTAVSHRATGKAKEYL